MNVAGALHEAGSSPLRNYVWGETVVGIVNAALPNDKAVTVENTGYEVKERLEMLPNNRNDAIMSISLRAFDVAPVVRSPTEGQPVVGGTRATDPESEKSEPNSPIRIISAGGLVIIAIIVALGYTSVAVKTGEIPDSGTLEAILKIIYALATGEESPAGN